HTLFLYTTLFRSGIGGGLLRLHSSLPAPDRAHWLHALHSLPRGAGDPAVRPVLQRCPGVSDEVAGAGGAEPRLLLAPEQGKLSLRTTGAIAPGPICVPSARGGNTWPDPQHPQP